MNKIELSAYGVEEMNCAEMQEADGGSFWDAVKVAAVGVLLGPIALPAAAVVSTLIATSQDLHG